ncbi:MAG: sulfurtransferase TusA family protein [Candidatus Calescibacterium sp.]|nr:sulfurtransferase TusA family protein [Candidatus Calescibacterium sp.]MCX7733439.1 sulfurtransferase TusA family protein [bacterium]MDW8087534.1 sulfurtransferase TusA family protein [Candidatus Calescibacterium sp.]
MAQSNQIRPSKVLDLRGVVCPMNVIIAKKELKNIKKGEIYEIIVDFPAAKDDVPRAIKDDGYKIVRTEERENSLEIYVSKE